MKNILIRLLFIPGCLSLLALGWVFTGTSASAHATDSLEVTCGIDPLNPNYYSYCNGPGYNANYRDYHNRARFDCSYAYNDGYANSRENYNCVNESKTEEKWTCYTYTNKASFSCAKNAVKKADAPPSSDDTINENDIYGFISSLPEENNITDPSLTAFQPTDPSQSTDEQPIEGDPNSNVG